MRKITFEKPVRVDWNVTKFKKIIELKNSGLTDKMIAEKIGTSWQMVAKILNKLREDPEYKVPYVSYIPDEKLSELTTMFPKYNDYLKVKEKDVMIISDLHLPFIKLDLWRKCKLVAKKEKINSLIIAGDICNQDAFTHYVSASGRGSHRQEKRVIETFFDDCLYNFNKVYFIAGNHDLRFFKLLLGEVDVPDFFKIFTDQIGKRIFVSSNYRFLTLNDKIHIMHPKNYSKISTRVSEQIAIKLQKNVLSGHGHHQGIRFEPSGKLWCIDIGCMINPKQTEYTAIVDSCNPNWNRGFVSIQDYIYPTLYNDYLTNWKKYGII